VISNGLQGVYHFNHMSKTLSRRELQQRSDLRHIDATLILQRLQLGHSLRICQEFEGGGAGRARTDDDQIMSWLRLHEQLQRQLTSGHRPAHSCG
jgi:hypothetical protein